MSGQLQFLEAEEAQALLQDVLAFIDTCENVNASTMSPTSVQPRLNVNGDRANKRRPKGYFPDYERCRREKKKAEREILRSQVAQYETQLELLRLQKPIQVSPDSKWGWVEAATEEEEKRRKAEELNRQLRGMLSEHLNTAQAFKNFIAQEADFAKRVQSVMNSYPPSAQPIQLNTFSSLGDISTHLKGMFGRIRDSADHVFEASSIFGEDAHSLGTFACLANVKYGDPIAGSCIELLSSTPLPCNVNTAGLFLWDMLLGKKVFGPNPGCYTMKTKQLTQSSAEMGYSISLGAPGASGALDGVTLMEKFNEVNRAVFVWTSMMVEADGKSFFRSQGWISVTKLPRNPQSESVVRMCSRLSGRHFGVPCDGADVDIPVARNHQFMAKARQECVQMRILERAERQV